jgi:hypothetical protein
MTILDIEHVQIAIPIASEERARGSYSGVLEFREIAKPAEMAETQASAGGNLVVRLCVPI